MIGKAAVIPTVNSDIQVEMREDQERELTNLNIGREGTQIVRVRVARARVTPKR